MDIKFLFPFWAFVPLRSPWSICGLCGFSLFGGSGDKTTTQTTVNTTTDTTTTTSNSNNVATNTANTLNAALTNNQSFIKNDSLVQNTALQLTDSFNKISNQNWQNVGNTTIGPSPAVSDYAAFFRDAPQAKNTQTPVDLTKPLLDFNGLSQLNASQLTAIAKLTDSVQTGFVKNVEATGSTTAAIQQSAGGNAGVSAKTWLYLGIGGAAFLLLIAFVLRRR